jgi:hypothetical protein
MSQQIREPTTFDVRRAPPETSAGLSVLGLGTPC